MTLRVRLLFAAFRRAWRDRRGITTVMVGLLSTALFGTAALGVDAGVVMSARAALRQNTDSAALAAAQVWATSGSQANATSTATGWHTSNVVALTSGVTPITPTYECISNVTGLPACNATNPNVISFTQTATVPTFFARVLGINSVTISATAGAAKGGGATTAMNIVFVVDSTGSMESTTDDTGCQVPGIKRPTKYDCALYGVQLVLKQLNPQVDQVGLLIFPGQGQTWTPCNSMNSIPYGSSPIYYQTLSASTLSSDYATATGTLNDTSTLIQAVGDNVNGASRCLSAPGGESTYYAEALQYAQKALNTEGQLDAQNVIIFLSDGASNAPNRHFDSTYATSACSPASWCTEHQVQQCNQGVQQAAANTAAGTWVYAIAYDSPTSSDSSDCPTVTVGKQAYYDSPDGTNTNTWTPCSAMQNIASTPARFFSTNSACSSVNNYSDVATAFQQVGQSLTSARLVF